MAIRNVILVVFTTSGQIKEGALEEAVSERPLGVLARTQAPGAEVGGVFVPVQKTVKSGYLLVLLSLPPPRDEELPFKGRDVSTSGHWSLCRVHAKAPGFDPFSWLALRDRYAYLNRQLALYVNVCISK